MKSAELSFHRPVGLEAVGPPETRGVPRDEVRLLVSTPQGQEHAHFHELANFLQVGDLLVVNESATMPASLPARGPQGEFILNLSTDYGQGLWVAEPRWSASQPGPLPLKTGDLIQLPEITATMVIPFPGIPRLWFVQMDGDLRETFACCGQPIRYGYAQNTHSLSRYQTLFSRVPGSAEMPSAARPFSKQVLEDLSKKGVKLARLVLHTGVSSLEVETEHIESHTLYPEPFHIPKPTADAVNQAMREGYRVIAVGTTVVRALESAWDGERVRSTGGFTRLFIHPKRGVHVVNGLLTGLHDPITSHLAMLYAIAGKSMIKTAYKEAVQAQYLWHEFGDSHLILP